MRLNNSQMPTGGRPVITSDDVVNVSNSSQIGNPLSKTLESQQEDIDKLKSNVKWLYKYGGVGSGGSGGGSGSANWTATVLVNKIYKVNDGNTIPLNSKGSYPVSVSISRPGGRRFKAKIAYMYNKKNQEYSLDLYIDNEWSKIQYINIDENTVLTVTVTDDDLVSTTFTASLVTEPYSLKLDYVDQTSNRASYSLTSSVDDIDIFMNDGIEKGVDVELSYDAAINASISYNVEQNLGIEGILQGEEYELITLGQGLKSGKKYFTVPQSLFLNEDNAGSYEFTANFTISPENQSSIRRTETCICNIIPSGMFMKVTTMISGGKVYYKTSRKALYDIYKDAYDNYIDVKNNPESTQSEITDALAELNESRKSIYVFDTKIVNLNLKVYYGQNRGRQFLVDINKVNPDDSRSSVYTNLVLNERVVRSISIPSEVGENKIEINVSYGSDTQTFVYYYYVGESVNSLSFYHDRNGHMSSAIHNYFRAGDVTSAFSKYSLNSYIDMKRNSSEQIITNSIEAPSTISDVMISFGIQYSVINDTSSKIITISGEDVSQSGEHAGDITIYQNKITYNTGGGYNTATIFIPKEDDYEQMSSEKYHLLTIYKRFISKASGNNNKYEIIIYLDGVIEAAIPSFVQENISYSHIKLYNSNFSLNNVDVSFFNHTDSPNREETDTDLDDTYITQYYYAYLQYINSTKFNSDFVKILDYMGMFHENVNNNGFIEVDNGETTINNIAQEVNIPVLLIKVPLSAGTLSFGNWFTSPWAEGALDAGKRNVSIKYSNGKSTLQEINFPNELAGISFYIELQGSSTLRYRSKNLNLGITSNDQYTVLYTPNLKMENSDMSETELKEAHNTFLPEQVFTLKADVSDSTHSNNTAIGAFVNTNTTKFETNQENSRYGFRSYVKNCLLGYPVLVFLEDNDFDPVRYYYLGIYNFNLGRDSYFNMGYYNVNILDNLTAVGIGGSSSDQSSVYHDGFGIYYGHTDNISLKPGLVITEIQGGNSYYDFSQFDNSVLFPRNYADGYSMFGDFVPQYLSSDDSVDGTKYELVTNSIQKMVESISKAGGFIFENIGKRLPIDPSSNYGYDYGYNGHEPDSIYSSSNIVPNYKYQFKREYDNASSKNIFTVKSSTPYITMNDINSIKMAITDDDNIENPEYTRTIDYQSLVEYYTICMAFGLVDSVQKNLNLKTWTANATKTNRINGHVNPMFYVAFYDMDTCLGRDNAGKASAYFAFSDYWDARYVLNQQQSTQNNPVYNANAVLIERDFYPRNDTLDQYEVESGYDIPSSYLFAIAKYADLFNTSGAGQKIFGNLTTPEELWATWRSPKDISTPPSAINGELKDAKYFIDKYFIRNLDEIPEALFNHNYRFKYLRKQDTIFSPDDIESFHGRGIYELEDWLSGRFHILDAYFNITGIESYMQYLDNDGNWSDYKYNNTNLALTTPPTLNTKNNEDIYVLKDIFTPAGGGYRKYSGSDIILTIQTRKLSPLIIAEPGQKSRYLFKNDNTKYHIAYRPSGSINIGFLGSNLWTYIESINSLVPGDNTSNFYINSDYLENLSGTSGICANWDIHLKSLRTVSLKSADYSGTLQFALGENGTVDNYPNLDTIDISGSCISLKVHGEGITSVDCRNVGSGLNTIDKYPELELNECKNLNSVLLTNAKLKECTIVPTWGKNVRIERSNIIKMTLAGKEDENGTYPSLTISGDAALTELTIQKFKSVNISGCPKLEKIIIQDTGILETLYVSGAYQTIYDLDVTGFRIYTSSTNDAGTPFTIDLSKQTAIKDIAFNEANGASPTKGFTKVILPSYDSDNNEKQISLRKYAFANTNLESIEFTSYSDNVNAGTLILGGRTDTSAAGIFYGTRYNIESPYHIYNKIIIPSNITSLENTFGGNVSSQGVAGQLNIHSIQILLGNYTSDTAAEDKVVTYENIENINNISYMFSSQTASYDKNLFATEYTAGYCGISIGRFVGAQNAEGIFSRLGNANSTVYISEKFFEWTSGSTTTKFGQNVDGIINISNMFTSTTIYLTKNTFRSIIDRVETMLYTANYMGSSQNKTCYLHQCDIQEGRVIETNISCHDIFNPLSENGTELHPIKLKTLCNVSFMCSQGYYVDFSNMFTPEWEALTDVIYCFNENSLPDGSIRNSLNLLGLRNISTLKSLNRSFMFNNEENMVNLGKFIDWESYISNISGFPVGYDYLNMSKYITRDDLYRVMNLISRRSETISTMTSMQYLFQKTLIVISSADDNDFFLQDVSEVTDFYNASTSQYRKFRKINDLSYTFINIKMGYEKEFDTNIDDDNSMITLDKFNLVPIHMNSNSLFGFSNLTVLHNTFSNINIEGNLPYNFFQKRRRESKQCYSETGQQIYLYTYTYDKTLEDISEIFKDTTISVNKTKRRFRGFYVNEGESIQRNYLGDASGNNLNLIKYKLTQNGALLDLVQNTEITDYEETRRTSHSYNDLTTIPINASSSVDIANFNYDDSWKDTTQNALLIFPPDILYGCNEGCTIDNAFSTMSSSITSSFEGILPSHMMNSMKGHTFTKPVYENLNVMPNKLFTIVSNSEDGSETTSRTVKNTIYLYIPNVENTYFSEARSYQGGFKFNLNIPNIESYSESTVTYDSFYILGSYSVRSSNAVSFKDSMPERSYKIISYENRQGNSTSIVWVDTHQRDFRTHYNIMIDSKGIEDLANTPNNGILHRIADDTDGYPVYQLEDGISMDDFRRKFEGFDYSKFTSQSLDIDGLVNENLGAIYFGHIFRAYDEDLNQNQFKPSNYASTSIDQYVVSLGGRYVGISSNLILPETGVYSKFLKVNGNYNYQIPGTITGTSMILYNKIWQFQFADYDYDVEQSSSSSYYNTAIRYELGISDSKYQGYTTLDNANTSEYITNYTKRYKRT